MMRMLFIGYGSISERHIRNVLCIKDDAEISVVRSVMGRQISTNIDQKLAHIYLENDVMLDYYDCIFITNPTLLHYKTLMKYLDRSDTFFVEKPVFMTGREDISLFSNTGKEYYVAAPLRYTNVIQWIKTNIDFSTVYAIRSISSSYLPEWRPGTDYTTTYSAHKDMGGGVSIDLIHEWDYITYLIGFPTVVKSIITRKSDLDIDSDDIAVYIAEYPDKVVEVHLDYFGREPIRRLELYTRDDTIIADLISQKISWLKSGREIDLAEDRDSYQKKELLHFIDIMKGKIPSDNGLEEACRVLRLARGVE